MKDKTFVMIGRSYAHFNGVIVSKMFVILIAKKGLIKKNFLIFQKRTTK